MATLLLRLAGPLQSWGAESKFETRRTELYPTKSGVIGLIAAALGLNRDADLSELRQLRFGIRVDSPGKVIKDFHMARKDEKVSYVTDRYYLSDAVFVVGLESDDIDLLDRIEYALKHPVYPIYLGRRSCPPSFPVCLGMTSESLKTSLEEMPWQIAEWRQKKENENLRIILEGAGKITRLVKDNPESFHPAKRTHSYRKIYEYVHVPETDHHKEIHDPFEELEG